MRVTHATLLGLVVCAGGALGGQETGLARQTAVVERQRAAAVRNEESLRRQAAAVLRQQLALRAGSSRAPIPEPTVESCSPVLPAVVDHLIEQVSAHHAVPSRLVQAVIQQESGFHPCAVSPKGAQGLMQLMPQVSAALGVRDPFDPAENIAAGTRLLRSLLDRYNGNLALALGAYNAGPTRVDRAQGVPVIPETQHYVQQILQRTGLPVVLPGPDREP